jgi:hypothetical protein
MSPAHRLDRRRLLRGLGLGLPGLLLGCGGGGSGQGPEPPPPIQGTIDGRILRSREIGREYWLRVYLPPASAGSRDTMSVIYLLDGDTWFEPLLRIVDRSATRALVVGIDSASRRDIDYVPSNSCTSGGGGQATFLAFLRGEALPHIQDQFGGNPLDRVLFGHSHGGGFALFAMLAEAPGAHSFRSYLACDASLGCYFDTATAWLDRYAAAHRALPVRLHLSHASQGNTLSNTPYGEVLAARAFEGFALRSQVYTGSHGGIVPQAFTEGLAFLRAP